MTIARRHKTISFSECSGIQDHIDNFGHSIKYIQIDSAYDVKINISGIDSFLGFRLDCQMPAGLIPQYYFNDTSTLYLISGYGNSYREIFLCHYMDKSITLSRFETSLTKECNFSVFVFKKPSDKTRIYCKGLFSNTDPAKGFLENNKKERSFKLPKEYWEEEIEVTELYPNYLHVKFKSGKELKIFCDL